MKRLHRNTSAALSSVLALSAAASIAHANDEESDECEEKEEDAEGQEEDACPVVIPAVAMFAPLLLLGNAEETEATPAPSPVSAPPEAGDPLHALLASFTDVEGVLGIADNDGNGSIDAYVLATRTGSDVNIYEWQWSGGINTDTAVTTNGADTSTDPLGDAGAYNGTHWCANSNGGGGSTSNGGTSFASQLVRNVTVDQSDHQNMNLDPGYIYAAGGSWYHNTQGPSSVTGSPAGAEQSGVDNWGLADISGDDDAEFWHWDGSAGAFHIYTLSGDFDLAYDAALSSSVNTALDDLLAAKGDGGDIRQLMLHDFDGDGDVDLGWSGGITGMEIGIFELIA